jgi:LPS-assembly protein
LLINTHYEKISDKDYYNDFGTGIAGVSTTYGSRYIEAIYEYNDWKIYGEFLGYQTFDKSLTSEAEPYDLLPKIEISKRWNRDLANFDILTSITEWEHDYETKVDGTRSDFQFGVDKTFSMKGLTITPRLKLQHTQYNLENQVAGYSSSPSKTIPTLSLNSEMIFSKEIQNSNLVHQIKPRLFYLYANKENQDDIPIFDTGLNTFSYAQMFRDNRFSGVDRTSDANQLSISLSSNFYDLENFRNIFNISIGKIVYFEDRDISIDNNTTYTRTNSNLIAEMEYKPTENISLVSTFLYDTHADDKKTQFNNHTFQYRGNNNNIFNASYRYSKDDIAQGDMGFAWGIKNNLKVLGRWAYDFKNNLSNNSSGDDIEVLAGLEYESCCWKARLVQRRYKINAEEHEKEIQFQIMLKGFTDVGTPLGNTIESSIKGYIDKEY